MGEGGGYLVAWFPKGGVRVLLPVCSQHVVVVGAQVRANPCTGMHTKLTLEFIVLATPLKIIYVDYRITTEKSSTFLQLLHTDSWKTFTIDNSKYINPLTVNNACRLRKNGKTSGIYFTLYYIY